MRKLLLITFLLLVFAPSSPAQDLWDSLNVVRDLFEQDDDGAADSLLTAIEPQCLTSGNDSILAVYYTNKGAILWSKEEYRECIPCLKKAIELYEKIHIKDQDYLDAFQAIGYSYGCLKDYANAERYYRKALIKSAILHAFPEFQPTIYKNLANLYMAKGDTLMAQKCLQRVDSLAIGGLDFMDMDYAKWETACWEKAAALLDSEKYAEAADFLSEFSEGIKNKKGRRYGDYLLSVDNRAVLLSRYLNRIDEAIPLYEELVALADSIDGPNKNICNAYCNLAACYSQKADFNRADEIIRQGVSYLTLANNPDFPVHAIYRYAGNGAYWNQDFAQAIPYYEKYLSPQNPRESENNYEEITNMLSVAYIFSNHPDKAAKLLSDFLKTDERRIRKDNPPTLALIYHNYGRALMLTGSKSDALSILNKSKQLQVQLNGQVNERTQQYINECSQK